MRIALVTQYFWPESFSINELVLKLEDLGHTVDVFTGKPNYPEGKVFPGYKQEGFQEEHYGESTTIYRAPLAPRGAGRAKHLVRNYLSFVWNGIRDFPKHIKKEQYDIIFVFTLSPITSVLPAIYLKHKLKKPLVIWVLDLWPDSLQATGHVKNRAVLACVGLLVRFIYSQCSEILVQSRGFINEVKKYTRNPRIQYFSNFADDFQAVNKVTHSLSNELVSCLKQNFCVVFAGNIGTAQAIPTLIKAASALQDLVDVKIVLVGSGSLSQWLQDNHPSNVMVAGRYPSESMPALFALAQGLIVSLTDEQIFSQTVPAKIQTYMSAAKPIIASINGEGARVVKEAGCGLVSPAEDSEQLANNIRQLYAMTAEQRDRLGASGRAYFLQNFEITLQAKKLVSILAKHIPHHEQN